MTNLVSSRCAIPNFLAVSPNFVKKVCSWLFAFSIVILSIGCVSSPEAYKEIDAEALTSSLYIDYNPRIESRNKRKSRKNLEDEKYIYTFSEAERLLLQIDGGGCLIKYDGSVVVPGTSTKLCNFEITILNDNIPETIIFNVAAIR